MLPTGVAATLAAAAVRRALAGGANGGGGAAPSRRLALARALRAAASTAAGGVPAATTAAAAVPVASGYAPTPTARLAAMAAAREGELADLGQRWHRQRLAWLVTGDASYTGVGAASAGGAAVASTAPATTSEDAAAPAVERERMDGGDLSEAECAALTARLAELRASRKRRRVRVNAASIMRVLRDPERSDQLAFTRSLPLPQMVELLVELWMEEADEAPTEAAVPPPPAAAALGVRGSDESGAPSRAGATRPGAHASGGSASGTVHEQGDDGGSASPPRG